MLLAPEACYHIHFVGHYDASGFALGSRRGGPSEGALSPGNPCVKELLHGPLAEARCGAGLFGSGRQRLIELPHVPLGLGSELDLVLVTAAVV